MKKGFEEEKLPNYPPQVESQRKCKEFLIIKANVKHGRRRKGLFLFRVLIYAVQTLLKHIESAQEVQAEISLSKVFSFDAVFYYLIPGCVRQVSKGGQVDIQVDIEELREDKVVAHNVHWVPDFS